MFSDPDTLSSALWVEILQHVPQQQRLSQCALVCTVWAPAAAQATVNVERQLQADAVPAFKRWLAVHAGQLRSLKLSQCSGPPPMLWLPLGQLTQLQHLELQGFKLSVTAGQYRLRSNVANIGDAAQPPLANLQHLELRYMELANVSTLLQLIKAPQLTTLILPSMLFTQGAGNRVGRFRNWEATAKQLAEAMPGLLQQLPRLSVLQLEDISLTEAARQQIANLQSLQSFTFTPRCSDPAFDLQLLPSSITQLHLHGYRRAEQYCPILPPEPRHLSGLLQLDVSNCGFPPEALGKVTQLQVLRLKHCQLLPVAAGAQVDTAGAAALLEVLAKLQQLQELKLELQGLNAAPIAPQQFSALTASSHLTKLAIKCIEQAALPKGTAQHMFPPNKQLRSLQFLEISTELEECWHDNDTDEWCLDAAAISSISSCCPNLQCLDITCSVKPGGDYVALLQLPESCTALHVGGVAFADAAALVMAQLTQLRQLGWCWSPQFTIAGLEDLAGLDLQQMYVYDTDVSVPPCEEWPTRDPKYVDLKWDPKWGSVSDQMHLLVLLRRTFDFEASELSELPLGCIIS